MKKIDNENKCIAYGAGMNSGFFIDTIRKKGIELLCICDRDESKQGMYIHGLEILSLKDAKAKYGNDIKVYITTLSPLKEEIAHELVSSGAISREQVANAEVREKYVGCWHLEREFLIDSEKINYCCGLGNAHNEPPAVMWKGSAEDIVKDFVFRRDELIYKVKNGLESPCSGCPNLQERLWDPDKKVRTIAFSLQYPCNYSCVYCRSRNMRNKVTKEYDDKINSFDFASVLKMLETTGNLALETPIELSAGEITINPQKEKIYQVIRDYPVMFFTNGYIYDEEIARHISRDKGSFINCSVDAGTRETYKKVKGLDGFERVREHIYKYSVERGGRVQLKYIVLNENCDKENLDGFVDLCIYCNVEAARISTDMCYDLSELPERIIEGAEYLKKRLRDSGIVVYIMDTFGTKITKIINEY